MKLATIQSSWMRETGYRLDPGPYVGGAIQMKVMLDALPFRKDYLSDVTIGIFHAGRESRTWVDSPEFGIPFLSGSALQNSDFSSLPFIAKSQVSRKPEFLIHKGYTLITRSGTIGKMAYCRDEMDGLACSEHILRVAPNPDLIPPGYLYAFLSSDFGVPLITAGTFGSIIQSIGPEHIETIEIPRLGLEKEQEIHELVAEAGRLRSEATKLRKAAINSVEDLLESKRRSVKHRNIGSASSVGMGRRLDAHFHSQASQAGRTCLEFDGNNQSLGSLTSDVFAADRGPRKKVETIEFGIPFISSSTIFHTDPIAGFLISNRTKKLESFLIEENDLLVPRSGSIGGIIGRAVMPVPQIYGNAATEHLVHIRTIVKEDAAYLYAILASKPGYQAILSTAFGSAIPSLDCELIKSLRVPILSSSDYDFIVSHIQDSVSLSQRAIEHERSAVEKLTKALELH